MGTEINYEIYSGAGNDFVMIDNLDERISLDEEKKFTIKICNENFKNIDGVIFVDKPLNIGSSLRMNYYNRDGSFGAMCGNGARCISMFAYKNEIVKEKEFILEAVDEVYKSHIIDDLNVKIIFPQPKEVKTDIKIKAEFGDGLKDLNVSYVNVGSDHIVLCLDDETNKIALGYKSIDEIDVNYIGKILRYHNEFQPRGANVNFVLPVSKNEIKVRTYERGVERETLACGTGIIASGIVFFLLNKASAPIRILAKSGEWLIVDFDFQNNSFLNLSLTGSAKKISGGELI